MGAMNVPQDSICVVKKLGHSSLAAKSTSDVSKTGIEFTQTAFPTVGESNESTNYGKLTGI
jgi:hypothetical protein